MKRLKLSSQCQCCQSPHRKEIDKALIRGITKTSLSQKYGVSVQSLSNHEKNHITRQLSYAVAQGQMSESTDLLQELEDLLRKAKRVLHIAEADEKWYLVLESIKGARGVIELMAKLVTVLHQIRLTELETARELDGSAQEERDAVWAEKLKILTDNELMMFYNLREKVDKQTHSIIIPDEDTSPRLSRKEHRQRQEEIEKLKGEQEEPAGEEDGGLRPGPITPRQIPDGRDLKG
jgi:hypothetical protein